MCPNCADCALDQLDSNTFYCEGCGQTFSRDGDDEENEEECEEVEAPVQFESREEAIKHAEKHGLPIDVWEARFVE